MIQNRAENICISSISEAIDAGFHVVLELHKNNLTLDKDLTG